MFNIIVHYPESQEKMQELEKRVAVIYAQTVAGYVEHLRCPKGQKIELIRAIAEDCKNKAKTSGQL